MVLGACCRGWRGCMMKGDAVVLRDAVGGLRVELEVARREQERLRRVLDEFGGMLRSLRAFSSAALHRGVVIRFPFDAADARGNNAEWIPG